VKSLGVRKGGQSGDGFKLTEQLADDFAGILAATQIFHLLQDSAERGFGLFDRDLGVILAMRFQALMMFLKFFAEKIGETLARCAVKRPRRPDNSDIRWAAFDGHAVDGAKPV